MLGHKLLYALLILIPRHYFVHELDFAATSTITTPTTSNTTNTPQKNTHR